MIDLTFEKAWNPPDDVVKTINEGIESYALEELGGEKPQKTLGLYTRSPSGSGSVIAGALGRPIRGRFYLHSLWVAQAHRSQGYGSGLLAAIEQEVLALECEQIILNTLNQRAVGFYRQHGYEIMTQIPDYIRGLSKVYFRKII